MTFLDDPTLTVLAQSLNDIEGLRKAQANRLRALTTTEPDKDGAVRGFSLPPDHPAVAAVAKSLTRLDDAEHEAVLALQRQLRTHPLWPWVKAQHGLGAKTVARFLGLIGDPYQWVHLRTGEVHTRSVGQLFAYVGVAGPGYNSRRDTSNGRQWNRDARTRLWVCVEKIATKPGSRYCDVYRAGRDRYEDKTHTEPCAACGVKGKPAQPGDPWRPGHQHAGALRLVMREVLRDLWTEARRLHQASGGMQVAA